MQVQNIEQPLLTLSIVSHGDVIKVKQLLESLRRYECADQCQVIITDNLGDNLPEIDESEWQSLTIIRNEKTLGFAGNHNQAFQLATGRYFCTLNPDVVFEQGVFETLITLIRNKKADIVAPLIVDSDGVSQDSFRNYPTPFEIIRRRLPGYRYIPPFVDSSGLAKPDWIAGIFMVMESETYRKIKGFNEKYRLYFEDVEFCARAQLAGLKLVVDTNVYVLHDAHRASRKRFIYLLWHIQSAIRFFASPVYRGVTRKSK